MRKTMSFPLTTKQILNRTKTVTRLLGWWELRPGDIVWCVNKTARLKKNETREHLATIRILSARAERLNSITQEDVIKEGFPDWTPDQFVHFLCHQYTHITATEIVNRIEFEYVEDREDE